jgi:deferrochelatase/peroxidase EfeB
VSEHGTIFVGFCATQRPLAAMLESMIGVHDGLRDDLTRFSQPQTGAYYVIPRPTDWPPSARARARPEPSLVECK